ncbi:hypothetical protein DXO150_20385, partial [Xanthomonas oryzae pv. oryzae]
MGSDYLLRQMGYSADGLQKRLGDGYYEQKLVREQIGQLTGRRFLDGYKDDEAQYQALLDAGATIGKAWNLRPGVALSEAQMAQLTSDIVWLVEQTVTLPDGSTTTALVPQVYLDRAPGRQYQRHLIAADTAAQVLDPSRLQGHQLTTGDGAGVGQRTARMRIDIGTGQQRAAAVQIAGAQAQIHLRHQGGGGAAIG